MTPIQDNYVVADISLSKTSPTDLTYHELYTWVIWQLPKQKNGGHCGAVHPPIPGHGWIPALITLDKKRVSVYAHLKEKYPSPELAAEHFSAPA